MVEKRRLEGGLGPARFNLTGGRATERPCHGQFAVTATAEIHCASMHRNGAQGLNVTRTYRVIDAPGAMTIELIAEAARATGSS